MFGDRSATFREFAMKEPLPLAKIHEIGFANSCAIEMTRCCSVVHAINAYVDEPRMTQDADAMSPRAAELAEEIRAFLAKEFTIAARVREVAAGHGFRVYQLRQPKNRHLVNVGQVADLPPNQLIAEHPCSDSRRTHRAKSDRVYRPARRPKSGPDWRDLTLVLGLPWISRPISGPVFPRV